MLSLNELLWFYSTYLVVFAIEILICGWSHSSLYLLLFPKKEERKSVLWEWVALVVEVFGLGAIMLGIFILWEKPIYNFLQKEFGLELWPGPQTFLFGLGFYIIYDFLSYWFHRAEHKFSLLWNGHQFHHSATVITTVTNDRDHPVRSVLHFKKILFLVFGVYVFNIYVMQFRFLMNRLAHSRIDTNYGWFGRYIVSPRYHHSHHDINGMRYNYAEMFVIWDHLFKTYRAPDKSIHVMKYGLSENFFEMQHPLKAYFKPFVDFYFIPAKKIMSIFVSSRSRSH